MDFTDFFLNFPFAQRRILAKNDENKEITVAPFTLDIWHFILMYIV